MGFRRREAPEATPSRNKSRNKSRNSLRKWNLLCSTYLASFRLSSADPSGDSCFDEECLFGKCDWSLKIEFYLRCPTNLQLRCQICLPKLKLFGSLDGRWSRFVIKAGRWMRGAVGDECWPMNNKGDRKDLKDGTRHELLRWTFRNFRIWISDQVLEKERMISQDESV